MTNHQMIQSRMPVITYIAVILNPNNHPSNAIATSLTIGDVMRNVNVTHNGIPALRNQTKSGIAEQLQKGVITQKNEAKRYSSQ